MTDTAEENTDINLQSHECLICLENISENYYELICCGEQYCASCLELWRNSTNIPTCPKCRTEFSDDTMPPPPPSLPNVPSHNPSIKIINNNEVIIGNEIYVSRSEERHDMFYIRDTRDPNNNTTIYINDNNVTTRIPILQRFKHFFLKHLSALFVVIVVLYVVMINF